MQQKFIDHINSYNLCKQNQKILLAISGGMDSICMLHLFHSLNYNISIAHCNFQLRGEESNGDELFVKKLAEKLSIRFYSKTFETEKYASENGISIQMAARDLRYDWFKELKKQNNFDVIAIAHNKDDVIETFFNNLSRGTGIKGLTGIAVKSDDVIRPLLFASRDSIQKFMHKNNFEHREDSTNSSTKYSRNLIRHKIIPLFEELNPSFRNTMIENIDRLFQAESILNNTISNKLDDICFNLDNSIHVNIRKLSKLEPINTYLHELISPYGFSNTQVLNICESLQSETGKKFISSTHIIVKNRDELIIEKIKNLTDKEYEILSPNDNKQLPVKLEMKVYPKPKNINIKTDNNTALFDADKVAFPLKIRKWKTGDKFQPLGMTNYKKISDFFIDNKYSILEKDNIYILETNGNIMWIIGKRIDNRFKVTANTNNIFEIKID